MTDKKLDPSFDPASYYGSASWCAFILGRSVEWFKRNRPSWSARAFQSWTG